MPGLDPYADTPECEHGSMRKHAGFSRKSGKPFAGWYCRAIPAVCPPVWVDSDSLIRDALQVWSAA
jgi:hypothetical protein